MTVTSIASTRAGACNHAILNGGFCGCRDYRSANSTIPGRRSSRHQANMRFQTICLNCNHPHATSQRHADEGSEPGSQQSHAQGVTNVSRCNLSMNFWR